MGVERDGLFVAVEYCVSGGSTQLPRSAFNHAMTI
jgi:hypothetical protein